MFLSATVRILILAACLLMTLAAAEGATKANPEQDAPSKFEKDIAALEAQVKQLPTGGIIAIGSSTFRRWDGMAKDFAPLPLFNAAFGGSRTPDVLAALPRLVLPAKPKVVVYYCGDNDMSEASSDPEVPVGNTKAFITALRAALPEARLVYLSIKPSPKREAAWPKAQQVNAAIKSICAADPALTYVDFSPILLGSDGKPDSTLFVKDRLHVTKEAYASLAAVLKPAVEKAWRAAGGK